MGSKPEFEVKSWHKALNPTASPQVSLAVMPNTSGKMKVIDYKKFITIEPGKRSGKPCIRRLRITVYDVLNMLADGMNAKEITDDFPELTEEDILACLAYAADKEHKVAIFA